jgi:hypothetical protein
MTTSSTSLRLRFALSSSTPLLFRFSLAFSPSSFPRPAHPNSRCVTAVGSLPGILLWLRATYLPNTSEELRIQVVMRLKIVNKDRRQAGGRGAAGFVFS